MQKMKDCSTEQYYFFAGNTMTLFRSCRPIVSIAKLIFLSGNRWVMIREGSTKPRCMMRMALIIASGVMLNDESIRVSRKWVYPPSNSTV